ncbi:MAG TPA: hypothetical protein VGL58_15245 [Caulobacteraceae bacterium]|jgi:hypothetical protein
MPAAKEHNQDQPPAPGTPSPDDRSYRLADWARLRPPLHALKTLRYNRVTETYVRRPAERGDLAALRGQIAGGRVMVTVAFNDAQILERQIRAIQAFIPGPLHVVADNSRDEAAALEIEALCARLDTPYLRLPPNPWGPKSGSRSHGLALNWVWRQLIQPARPAAFGFLDHDLIPVAPDDPFAELEERDMSGDKRWMGQRWFLWAGYCFFRTAALDDIAVDFGQDWFVGLDTGGANWRPLYRWIDPASLHERPIVEAPLLPGVPIDDCHIERRGEAWVHEVGWGGCRDDLRGAKRAAFLALIDAALSGHERPSDPER